MDFTDGLLLRIFVGETEKHRGLPLYEWIIGEAREFGVAGATAIRGIAGYGGHHRIHTAKVVDLSLDLPVVVEIVDTEPRVRAFLAQIEPALTAGFSTLESVQFHANRAAVH